MPIRFVFLYFLLHLTLALRAQNYRPVLVNGREWTVSTSLAYEQCLQAMFPPWSDCTYRYRHYLNGDTSMGGLTFRKCMQQDFSISSSGAGPFTLGAPALTMLLREDANQRRLYMWHPDLNQEVLLADFNLSVGEQTTVWKSHANSLVTLQVDSTWLLPDGRRKWVLDDYNELVEGVGWSHGLGLGEICFEACQVVTCVKQQDTAIFNIQNWPFTYFSNGPSCDYEVVSAHEPPLTDIQVTPNPSAGLFHISGLSDDAHGWVFNAQGQLILDLTQVQQIDLSTFPSGIYLLRVIGPVSGFVRLVRQ